MCTADMLGHGEHSLGPLAALAYDMGPQSHHHRPHSEALPWALLAAVLGLLTFAVAFEAIRHCCKRRHRYKLPTLASQLSELSSQSDTVPNPLLTTSRPPLAVQEAGVIPKSEPDWIGNVPWSDWQIDQEDISLCQRPDGRLWELGAGASAKVSRTILSAVATRTARISQTGLSCHASWQLLVPDLVPRPTKFGESDNMPLTTLGSACICHVRCRSHSVHSMVALILDCTATHQCSFLHLCSQLILCCDMPCKYLTRLLGTAINPFST